MHTSTIKQQKSKFCPQIQRTEASYLLKVTRHWPVMNVIARFRADNLRKKN